MKELSTQEVTDLKLLSLFNLAAARALLGFKFVTMTAEDLKQTKAIIVTRDAYCSKLYFFRMQALHDLVLQKMQELDVNLIVFQNRIPNTDVQLFCNDVLVSFPAVGDLNGGSNMRKFKATLERDSVKSQLLVYSYLTTKLVAGQRRAIHNGSWHGHIAFNIPASSRFSMISNDFPLINEISI